MCACVYGCVSVGCLCSRARSCVRFVCVCVPTAQHHTPSRFLKTVQAGVMKPFRSRWGPHACAGARIPKHRHTHWHSTHTHSARAKTQVCGYPDTDKHFDSQTHTHECARKPGRTGTQTPTHTSTLKHVHTRVRACRAHLYPNTDTHIDAHTHTHTQTNARERRCTRPSPRTPTHIPTPTPPTPPTPPRTDDPDAGAGATRAGNDGDQLDCLCRCVVGRLCRRVGLE